MSTSHGKFVWYELMTTDMKAAEAFYLSAIGWTAKDSGMPDMAYTLLSAGDTQVGGLMAMPPQARDKSVPPHWIGYIAVDDVDAYAAKVKEAGGTIHYGPADIPGVGRFASVGDPQGASFALFKGASAAPPPAVAPNTPGHVGWRELYAAGLDTAFGFYSKLFGWTKADAMDMGPMGVYQIYAIAGVPSGGMMTKPKEMPWPAWTYYFNVDGIDRAMARVTAAGGNISMGPQQVPGGSWIAQCRDPQGAMFAMVAPQR